MAYSKPGTQGLVKSEKPDHREESMKGSWVVADNISAPRQPPRIPFYHVSVYLLLFLMCEFNYLHLQLIFGGLSSGC